MVRKAVLVAILACAYVAAGDEKDPVKERLFAAKVAYDKQMAASRKQAGEWFDRREEAARKAGNKKAVDQIKAEREVFDETGELPKTAPAALRQKPALAKKALEAAYEQAVKEYTKAKKDDEAEAVEKALLIFRKEGWKHVDLTNVKLREDYLRIPPQTSLPTLQQHAGGVEIVVVARTESENIRLDAQRGAVVIFNWEVNPRELRVCRPDGTDKLESGSLVTADATADLLSDVGGTDKLESGSLVTAKVTPLKPNTWYTIKWRLAEDGMQISVDGNIVFEERKRYDLTATTPIGVRSGKSNVDVKEFRVIPLGKNR